jgi:hypothetical protein
MAVNPRVNYRRDAIVRSFLSAFLWLAAAPLGADAAEMTTFHGDATPLRELIVSKRMACLSDHLWTYRDTALCIDTRPANYTSEFISFRPMHPVWVWHKNLRKASPQLVPILERATLIQVLQANTDPKMCGVNILSGRRILSQSWSEQDKSSEYLPCANLAGRLPLEDSLVKQSRRPTAY